MEDTPDTKPIYIPIPEFKIKYKDVFHLKNLYVMIHEYLAEEGFLDNDQGSGNQEAHRYAETLYMEKFVQKGINLGGKEMWVYWRVKKDFGAAGRQNTYFKEFLEIDMHMAYVENVEIVHQGRKMTAQKAEIEMFFRPYINGDMGGSWGKHPLLKHFKHIYEERIMRVEIEKKEKDLWREAYRIQARAKQFLELRQQGPVSEPFFARKFGYEG